MSEQVPETGGAKVALVSHAAGRGKGKHSGHRLLVSSCMYLIRDKKLSQLPPMNSAAQLFSSILLLRSRYPFSITRLKGGLL